MTNNPCPGHLFENGTCVNCGGAEPESNQSTVELRHISAVDSEVAGKLLKMLSLANDAKDDSTRQGEFESAMAAAAKFSQRHSIDLSSIDITRAAETSGVTTERFLNQRIKVAEGLYRRPPAHKFVCAILGTHFSVEIIRGIGTSSSIIWIIGRESHVKFAEYAYFFLVETFNRFWRAEKLTNDRAMTERASYFYGFWWGLHEKLTNATREGAQEIIGELAEKTELATSDVTNKYQLVLAKEKDLLKQATSEYHPVLIPGKNDFRSGVRYGSALYQGKHDGATVEVNRQIGEESEKLNRAALK